MYGLCTRCDGIMTVLGIDCEHFCRKRAKFIKSFLFSRKRESHQSIRDLIWDLEFAIWDFFKISHPAGAGSPLRSEIVIFNSKFSIRNSQLVCLCSCQVYDFRKTFLITIQSQIRNQKSKILNDLASLILHTNFTNYREKLHWTKVQRSVCTSIPRAKARGYSISSLLKI
jgi:hypothetical protein